MSPLSICPSAKCNRSLHWRNQSFCVSAGSQVGRAAVIDNTPGPTQPQTAQVGPPEV